MESLSDAQILLLASQLTASPDIPKLRTLAATRNDVLTTSILYRILLTYLPADINADTETEQQLIGLLEDIETAFSNYSVLDAANNDLTSLDDLRNAERLLASLRLERIPVYDSNAEQDSLSDFLIAWIRKIEAFSGLHVTSLVFAEHFVSRHAILGDWVKTYMKPLFLLQNEFYVDQAAELSLQDIENAQGQAGVGTLLQFSKDPSNVGRDLDQVVTPWVRGGTSTKRRRISGADDASARTKAADWQDVNYWIFDTAQQGFDTSSAAAESWDGPASGYDAPLDTDEDIQDAAVSYVRTILALVYISAENDGDEVIRKKHTLLRRAANLAQLMPPHEEVKFPNIPDLSVMQNATRADLFESKLLSEDNLLTRPSSDVIDFLSGILASQQILSNLKINCTTRSVSCTTLFESEDKQKQELRSILNQVPRLTKSHVQWSEVRTCLQWLRTWSTDEAVSGTASRVAYLGRLSEKYIESELLQAILAVGDLDTVKETYLTEHQQVLSRQQIRDHILSASFNFYDNASNGNRTRGGVKKAADMVQAFRGYFDDTKDFENLEHLIKATHSLSFYQLTLQYGVPFQPVSIRASSDPLSLIEKVLDQNNKAYTKLDDLLRIARDLALAGLHSSSSPHFAPGEEVPIEKQLADAQHRITYSAIEAALADHDFDTAYSLITTRLSTAPGNSGASATDDTSWRAAYAAGKYRPSSSPSDIHKQIASLQKRMELLSTALTLAPTSEPLPEILNTWRRCEEELDSLKTQALEEERAFDAHSDNALPGVFGPDDRMSDAHETQRLLDNRKAYNSTGPSYEEEAPMGLFDVARGAASALRKNAFPLRGAQGHAVNVTSSPPRQSLEGVRSSGESERPGSADGNRVRKRDMLSNAVSGGFVSGMSWVLGAPPAAKQTS